jgi:hypothetical protein
LWLSPFGFSALSAQVKSLDWVERQCARICMLQEQVVTEGLRKLNTLLDARAET